MSILPARMYVHQMCFLCLSGSEEAVRFLETGVTSND